LLFIAAAFHFSVSHMGDFALAVIISAGDLVAYIIGKVLGRKFHLDREKAQKVGQIVFASAVICAGLFVTILGGFNSEVQRRYDASVTAP
jgi:CDP-diglyceride synthetase